MEIKRGNNGDGGDESPLQTSTAGEGTSTPRENTISSRPASGWNFESALYYIDHQLSRVDTSVKYGNTGNVGARFTAFVNELEKDKVISPDEFNEINGKGLFNLAENVRFMKDLLQKKEYEASPIYFTFTSYNSHYPKRLYILDRGRHTRIFIEGSALYLSKLGYPLKSDAQLNFHSPGGSIKEGKILLLPYGGKISKYLTKSQYDALNGHSFVLAGASEGGDKVVPPVLTEGDGLASDDSDTGQIQPDETALLAELSSNETLVLEKAYVSDEKIYIWFNGTRTSLYLINGLLFCEKCNLTSGVLSINNASSSTINIGILQTITNNAPKVFLATTVVFVLNAPLPSFVRLNGATLELRDNNWYICPEPTGGQLACPPK